MVRRALFATLGLALACTAMSASYAGEKAKRQRKQRKPKAPAVSAEEYAKQAEELLTVATELGAEGAEAKLAALKERAANAFKALKWPQGRIDKILQSEDPKRLSAQINGFAFRAVVGKLTAERRDVLKSNPQLTQELEQLKEKQKLVEQEFEAFYAKLKPLSPGIAQLEGVRETLVAERKRQQEEARQKRTAAKAGRQKRQGKNKKKQNQ